MDLKRHTVSKTLFKPDFDYQISNNVVKVTTQ